MNIAQTAPRISVVMPVYNVEAYIADAIGSVLAQSFTDFELLIVDDGGTDKSIEICRSFDDPRIRIISQVNRGLAGARNSGILRARGNYIALIDSDDMWHRDKLSLHAIHLDNNPDVGLSYSGSRFVDAKGRSLRQAQRPKLSDIQVHDILCRNPVGNGSAPVIRKSVLDKVAFLHPREPDRICFFDENFRQSEDIEMWLRLALVGQCKFEGIKGLLTFYRIVSGALSANIIAQYDSWQSMIAKTREHAPEFVARHERAARAFQLRYLARRAVQLGDGVLALSLLRDAWQCSRLPFLKEPGKTAFTYAAAMASRLLPAAVTQKLAHRWTGAKVVG